MRKTILFVAVSILFTLSCKKKDDPSCSINMTSISGSYKLKSVQYKSSSSAAPIDYLTEFIPDDCERDDVLSFQSNGTYQYQDAGTACTPTGDDSGTWSVSGKTMTVDGIPIEIQSFNCSELLFISTGYLLLGDQLIVTYQKQ